MPVFEIIAGTTAVIYGIKFLRGRKVVMERKGGVLRLTGPGQRDFEVPEVMRTELMESMNRVNREASPAALPKIVQEESRRLVEICRRRRLVETDKVIQAFTSLTHSRRDLVLALHQLENVGKEIEKRELSHEIEMGDLQIRKLEQQDKTDEIARRAAQRDRAEAREKLDDSQKRWEARESRKPAPIPVSSPKKSAAPLSREERVKKLHAAMEARLAELDREIADEELRNRLKRNVQDEYERKINEVYES